MWLRPGKENDYNSKYTTNKSKVKKKKKTYINIVEMFLRHKEYRI